MTCPLTVMNLATTGSCRSDVKGEAVLSVLGGGARGARAIRVSGEGSAPHEHGTANAGAHPPLFGIVKGLCDVKMLAVDWHEGTNRSV